MKPMPFVLKLKPGQKNAGIDALRGLWTEIKQTLDSRGAENVSIWGIADFLFCYGEYPDDFTILSADKPRWKMILSPLHGIVCRSRHAAINVS